jgi:hypothetical protein
VNILSLFNGKTPSLGMDNLVRFQEGVDMPVAVFE